MNINRSLALPALVLHIRGMAKAKTKSPPKVTKKQTHSNAGEVGWASEDSDRSIFRPQVAW